MSQKNVAYVWMACVCLVLATSSVKADEHAQVTGEIVEYRLATWKTIHAEGEEGQKVVDTLKRLRCEVQVDSHGGHTDVKYRSANWQQLSLPNHDVAHQWTSWLKNYGFETKHEH